VPQRVFVLPALPKGPTGKIVRREVAVQLAQQPGCGPASATSPPAAGDREDQLRRVWSEVLEIADVSPDDDYFAIGGDSLRALTIINKANALGVELTMMDLMRHRSIRRICANKAAVVA
jgi:hypothetical protein